MFGLGWGLKFNPLPDLLSACFPKTLKTNLKGVSKPKIVKSRSCEQL